MNDWPEWREDKKRVELALEKGSAALLAAARGILPRNGWNSGNGAEAYGADRVSIISEAGCFGMRPRWSRSPFQREFARER